MLYLTLICNYPSILTISVSLRLAIRNIGKIWKYLTQENCERLFHAFITSKLDSCNSILYSLPVCEIDKLQHLQNTAVRLVTRVKKNDHITSILRNLQWLPVRDRIIFKVLLISFKALHGQAPQYISELLDECRPSRTLTSRCRNLLTVPRSYTVTYGDRSFSVAAAKL